MKTVFTFLFLFALHIALPPRAFAISQPCESLFQTSQATSIFEVRTVTPSADEVKRLVHWQHALVKISRPFYEASRRRMEEKGATVGDYIALNVQLRDRFPEMLRVMGGNFTSHGTFEKIVEHALPKIWISHQDRKEYRAYIRKFGSMPLSQVEDQPEFKLYSSRLITPVYGTIGEVMVAGGLLGSRNSNKNLRGMIGEGVYQKSGLSEAVGKMEIDSSDRRFLGGDIGWVRTLNEVKFGFSRVTLESFSGKQILRQAAKIQAARAKIHNAGFTPPNHVILLMYPHVEIGVVNALTDLGTIVVVIDPTTPINTSY